METKKIYKIMRVSDGKFSVGGSWPTFTNEGKTWHGEKAIKAHLRLFRTGGWHIYKDCKLMAYEVTEAQDESFMLEEIFDGYKNDATAAMLRGDTYW